MWRHLRLIAALTALLLPVASFAQQLDPRQVLAAVIQQLSTGQPNPAWYGTDLWQTIAQQTNNTGIYPQLVQAGQVTNITLLNQQPVPAGIIYQMRSQHASGASFLWLLGINSTSNRIEAMQSNPEGGGAPGPQPQPQPQPQPRLNPQPDGRPRLGPTPGTGPVNPPSSGGGDACARFPDLC